MQHKSIYKSQHIFIFDYRNRFRRCNAQTLIFTVANFPQRKKQLIRLPFLQGERSQLGRGNDFEKQNKKKQKEIQWIT